MSELDEVFLLECTAYDKCNESGTIKQYALVKSNNIQDNIFLLQVVPCMRDGQNT